MLSTVLMLTVMQAQGPGCGSAPPTPPPVPGDFTMYVPANDANETFYLAGPDPATVPPGGAPLLVLFHGFGDPSTQMGAGSHDEHLSNEFWGMHDLIDRAVCRGWYVLMHDGGDVLKNPNTTVYSTYGSERFQRATEAVLDRVTCWWPVDMNRIYGVGFSMGAGEALAYAARHLDPTKPMFAGIVSQSGHLSSIYDYLAACTPNTNVSDAYGDAMNGLLYCGNEFEWRRATTFDMDMTWGPNSACGDTMCGSDPVGTPVIDLLQSQISNVVFLPTHLYYLTYSPTGLQETKAIVEPNDELHTWIHSIWPNSPYYLTVLDCANPPACDRVSSACTSAGPPPCCGPGCNVLHKWENVCSELVEYFFHPVNARPLTKQLFLNRVNNQVNLTLMAEDDKRYYHFEPVRQDDYDFARISWSYGEIDNSMTFTDTAAPNLDRLRIRADDQYGVLRQGDASSGDAEIRILTPVEWTGTDPVWVELTGYPQEPTQLDVTQLDSAGNPATLDTSNGLVWSSTSESISWEVRPHDANQISGDTYTWVIPPLP